MHLVPRLPRLRRSARPSVVVGVVLSAALLAACGNSSTPAPSGTAATPVPTAEASASGAAATASPEPSPTASAEASPSATAEAAGDACALATPAEMAEIVGGEVAAADMLAGGWVASACAWSGTDASFIVSLGTASSFEGFEDPAAPNAQGRLEQYRQQAGGEDVSGFGDGAVRSEIGMAAYAGDTYVEVEKLLLTDDQLTEIIELLVSRL